MRKISISNNTVLSNFAVIDRLDLLKDVYNTSFSLIEIKRI